MFTVDREGRPLSVILGFCPECRIYTFQGEKGGIESKDPMQVAEYAAGIEL
jgi:hypothetical protein